MATMRFFPDVLNPINIFRHKHHSPEATKIVTPSIELAYKELTKSYGNNLTYYHNPDLINTKYLYVSAYKDGVYMGKAILRYGSNGCEWYVV